MFRSVLVGENNGRMNTVGGRWSRLTGIVLHSRYIDMQARKTHILLDLVAKNTECTRGKKIT